MGSPSCLNPSDAHSAGDWGKGRMGFGLNLLLFLVAGVKKGGEKEKERFQGRRRGSGGWAQRGALVILEEAREGGGGIWRRLRDWSLAVRKGNSGIRGSRVEAEGGHPIHKEGVRWRCRGLLGSAETRLWPGPGPLSVMAWRGRS